MFKDRFERSYVFPVNVTELVRVPFKTRDRQTEEDAVYYYKDIREE